MNWGLGCVPLQTQYGVALPADFKWSPVVKFKDHSGPIPRCRFSPDGRSAIFIRQTTSFRQLASVSSDGFLRVYDLLTSRCVGVAGSHHGVVNDLAWDCLGQHLYTAGALGTVRCHSVGHLPSKLPVSPKVGLIGEVTHYQPECLPAHIAGKKAGAISSAGTNTNVPQLYKSVTSVAAPHFVGQFFLSGGYDELIRKWDIRRFSCVEDVRAHDGPIMGLDLSHDDRLIGSSSLDGYCRLWDVLSLEPYITFDAPEGQPPLGHCVFSEGGRFIICVYGDGRHRVRSVPQTRIYLDLLAPRAGEEVWISSEGGKQGSEDLLPASSKLDMLDSLVSEGPYGFADVQDGVVYIPYCNNDETSGVRAWRIDSGFYAGSLSGQPHNYSSITSVSCRQGKTYQSSAGNLMATSSGAPDNSVVVWCSVPK